MQQKIGISFSALELQDYLLSGQFNLIPTFSYTFHFLRLLFWLSAILLLSRSHCLLSPWALAKPFIYPQPSISPFLSHILLSLSLSLPPPSLSLSLPLFLFPLCVSFSFEFMLPVQGHQRFSHLSLGLTVTLCSLFLLNLSIFLLCVLLE